MKNLPFNEDKTINNKLEGSVEQVCNYCLYINKTLNFFFVKIYKFFNIFINKKHLNTLSTNSLFTIYIDSENQDLLNSRFGIDAIKLLGSGEVSIEKIYSFSLLFQILSFFFISNSWFTVYTKIIIQQSFFNRKIK